ncbi:DUF3221 domain-containing protein [Metabacillus elymi]|uniref:YobA family protein n=1 Tax=Metabacillus elymi TaxID=2745198 RepID=A0ABX6S0R0_9BACI|nr:DUF3221 domain-containing protein [Metabacillus sp. KUDC1714]QNF27397.1 YobA family protein [Metabacillus sp. KUDC1714]
MKRKLALIITISTIGLYACGNDQPTTSGSNEQPPKEDPATSMQLEGYVVEKTANTVLVVNPNPKEATQSNGPAYFSNTPDTLKIGDKVSISYDVMLESYPGQAEAKAVNVLESHKPSGADLTEEQVLNKALSNKELKTPILSVFHYNKETDTWKIQVDSIMGEKEEFIIEDKY